MILRNVIDVFSRTGSIPKPASNITFDLFPVPNRKPKRWSYCFARCVDGQAWPEGETFSVGEVR